MSYLYADATKEDIYLSNLNDNSILLPTNDICFEKLMANPKVRKGLIAALMGVEPCKIKSSTVLNPKTERYSKDDKYGILDVKVELDDGTLINIEMQVERYDYWDRRVLFYMGKTFTSQLKTGNDYNKLKKCIHASILNFTYFSDDKKCYRKIALCDVDTGKVYSDMLELHIMELKKLVYNTDNNEPIIRWMKFFNGKTRKEFEDMANIDEYIREAYEELVNLSADGLTREEYEEREKALRDHYSFLNDAKRRGLAEGRAEGRADTLALVKKAKCLYKTGKSIEEISLECNLSIEEVRDILE